MGHGTQGTRHHREGISLIKLSKMFPDDATGRAEGGVAITHHMASQIWAIAVYLMSTSLKGVSSMKQ